MAWTIAHNQPFIDRRQAGAALAAELKKYAGRPDVIVLALPRGGVPVAFEVARALGAPLDIFVVRKLGLPGHRELAMGAIASGGVRILNADVVRGYGIPTEVIDEVARTEQVELERRERDYRNGRPAADLSDKVVILIDDGLATGSTMKAAVEAVRKLAPSRVIVAVPVGAPETCREFAEVADEVACARTPARFSAVGQWYVDFSETSDEEVRALLRMPRATVHETVTLTTAVRLKADLTVPEGAMGLVIFAHGSGSSRFSSRNRAVAEVLQGEFATLLLDLLTREEEIVDEHTRQYRFDIERLGRRVVATADWAGQRPDLRQLRIGYFGASTGAAAALIAAAERPQTAGAVISRGGRPDLAGDALPRVQAPTLLIVGGDDEDVIELNRAAMRRMRAPVRLEIVPGASHLFEEPGAIEQVALLAADWCQRHLSAAPV